MLIGAPASAGRALRTLAGVLVLAGAAAGAQSGKVTFDDHVAPALRNRCLSCHNADRQRGGLDLSSYEGVMAGGGGGAVVVPGAPDDSRLFLLASHREEPKMPPSGERLGDDKLKILSDWIAGGLLQNASSKAKKAKKSAISLQPSEVSNEAPSTPLPGPRGLLMEPRVRTERPASASALAANPWLPLVAVAGQKQVLLFDVDAMELAGVLSFPEGEARSLRFSRNGRLLIAGGGKGASFGGTVVWRVEDGARVFEVGAEADEVLAADLSADQSLLAFSGPGKRIKAFSTADLQPVHDIKKHADWVLALGFSPDGVLLATGDRGGALHVWEAASGSEFYALPGHKGAVDDLAWRADSNVLASASEDGTIKLWEMFRGSQVKSWNAHGGGVVAVDFARDGRLVSAGRDRVVKVWDQEGKQLKAFPAFPDLLLDVVFTGDGRRVVASDWSGEIRVGDPAEGTWVGKLPPNPPTVAQRLAEVQGVLARSEGELVSLRETRAQREAEAEAPRARHGEAAAGLRAAQDELDGVQGELAREDQALAKVRAGHEELARAHQVLVETAGQQEQALQAAVARHAGQSQEYDRLAAGVESKRALVRSLEASLKRVEAELEKVPDDPQLRALQEQSAASAQAAKRFFLESRSAEVAAATALVESSMAVQGVREHAQAAHAEAHGHEPAFQQSAARLALALDQREQVVQRRDAALARRDAAKAQCDAREAEAAPFLAALDSAQQTLAQAESRHRAAQRQLARWTAELINIELYASRDQVERCIEDFEQSQLQTEEAVAAVGVAESVLGEAQVVAEAAPEEIARREQELVATLELPRAAEEVLRAMQAKHQGKQEFRDQLAEQDAGVAERAAAEPDNAVLAEALTRSRELVALMDRDLQQAQSQVQAAAAKLEETRSQVGAAERRLEEARQAAEDAQVTVAVREAELQAARDAAVAAREREAAAQRAIDAARARVAALREEYLSALPAGG